MQVSYKTDHDLWLDHTVMPFEKEAKLGVKRIFFPALFQTGGYGFSEMKVQKLWSAAKETVSRAHFCKWHSS